MLEAEPLLLDSCDSALCKTAAAAVLLLEIDAESGSPEE